MKPASACQLVHHGAGIDAESDEQRGKRVPQLVRRQALWERDVAGALESLVGALDRLREDSLVDIRNVEWASGRRREHRVVGKRRADRSLVLGELVAQRGQQFDHADAGAGLRLAHEDAVAGEVDVAPAQRRQLTGAQTGKDKRGEDRPARARIPLRVGFDVEFAGGGEQCLDLFGAIEPRRCRAYDAQPTAASDGGVLLDIAVLDSDLAIARKLLLRSYHTLRELGEEALQPA